MVSNQYVVHRCDRKHKKGGGVLLLLKRTLESRVIFKESVKDAYEVLVADVTFTEHSIRFILVYRAPNCTYLDT